MGVAHINIFKEVVMLLVIESREKFTADLIARTSKFREED